MQKYTHLANAASEKNGNEQQRKKKRRENKWKNGANQKATYKYIEHIDLKLLVSYNGIAVKM